MSDDERKPMLVRPNRFTKAGNEYVFRVTPGESIHVRTPEQRAARDHSRDFPLWAIVLAVALIAAGLIAGAVK